MITARRTNISIIAISVLLLGNTVCLAADVGDVAQIAARLKDADPLAAGKAAYELIALGKAAEPAIPQLIEALQDNREAVKFPIPIPAPKPTVATLAVFALAEIGTPAVPALIAVLSSPEELARKNAVATLGRIGNPAKDALDRLVKIVDNEKSDHLRYAGISAYGQIEPHGEAYIALLAKSLNDSSPEVRSLAICKLGDVGPAAASTIPALIGCLSDQESRSYSLSPCMGGWRAVRCDAVEALGKLGPLAKDAIVKLHELAEHDKDDEVRMGAWLALFHIDNDSPEALSAMIAALKEDSRAMIVAIESLQEIGPKAAPAFEALTKLLKSKNEYVRQKSVQAIGAIGGERTVPVLKARLRDKEKDVRVAAAKALGNQGEIAAPAVPALIKELTRKDYYSWDTIEILEALGRIGPVAKSALPWLKRLEESDSDEDVQKAAAEAIKRINGE